MVVSQGRHNLWLELLTGSVLKQHSYCDVSPWLRPATILLFSQLLRVAVVAVCAKSLYVAICSLTVTSWLQPSTRKDVCESKNFMAVVFAADVALEQDMIAIHVANYSRKTMSIWLQLCPPIVNNNVRYKLVDLILAV